VLCQGPLSCSVFATSWIWLKKNSHLSNRYGVVATSNLEIKSKTHISISCLRNPRFQLSCSAKCLIIQIIFHFPKNWKKLSPPLCQKWSDSNEFSKNHMHCAFIRRTSILRFIPDRIFQQKPISRDDDHGLMLKVLWASLLAIYAVDIVFFRNLRSLLETKLLFPKWECWRCKHRLLKTSFNKAKRSRFYRWVQASFGGV